MKLNKLELKRMRVYDAMREPTRKMAKEVGEFARREARGKLLIRYDLGVMVANVIRDPALYGQNGVEALARHWRRDPAELRDWARLAGTFTRQRMEQCASVHFANGAYITAEHLIEISRVTDPGRREKWLHRTFDEALTVRQLKRRIADETE